MRGAAFFDLDRTLLRRSSALWQALFVARGASGEPVYIVSAAPGWPVLRFRIAHAA